MTGARHCPDFHDATTVPALWDAARWFFRRLTGLCGTPCALAAEAFLSRKARREIRYWLAPVEGLVRRLLVVEAVRIAQTLPCAKEPPRGRRSGRRRKMKKRPEEPRTGGIPFPGPEDSSSWAVRLSLAGPPERPLTPLTGPRLRVLDLDDHANVLAPAAIRRAAEAHRERMRSTEEIPAPVPVRRTRRRRAGSPWPLARRIEAVRRVLENPRPYARRLARRLHEQADRLARACRPPPPAPPGRWPPPGETPLYFASQHALEALEAFDTG